MANPTTGELVLRNVWDEDSRSLKTTMVGSELSISLDHSDGDSVTTYPHGLAISTTDEINIPGQKTVCLYIEADGTGTAQAKLQISPVDSGDVWMDIASSTITADASNLTSGTPTVVCARRIRVVHVAGTPSTHLVTQAV